MVKYWANHLTIWSNGWKPVWLSLKGKLHNLKNLTMELLSRRKWSLVSAQGVSYWVYNIPKISIEHVLGNIPHMLDYWDDLPCCLCPCTKELYAATNDVFPCTGVTKCTRRFQRRNVQSHLFRNAFQCRQRRTKQNWNRFETNWPG